MKFMPLFTFLPITLIPLCFPGVLILLLIRKQWMWLFPTLGSMLLWVPGILIPFIAMPEGELCLRSYLRLWGLLYFCLLPSCMIYYSVKTKNRPLLIAALLSLLMNFGYISLCAFLFTVCKAM